MRPASVVTKRTEGEIKSAILLLLRAHGIACWLTGVGAYRATHNGRERFIRLGTKGMSDIVAVFPWCAAVGFHGFYPGQGHGCDPRYHIARPLFIEVKTRTGKVSPEQTAFLQTVVRAGGIGFVARSCEDVIDKLSLGR